MDLRDKARSAAVQVGNAILGKTEEIEVILLALLANGHILLEDIPGVGKTTLAIAYSKALQLDYKRIQFTPDVMPMDLTGFSIYRKEEERFVYQQGNVFCNLLLADEINRASPKTQSALLEVMEERTVTAEGVTRKVPEPFLVIATQNPFGAAGTQYLPESQMDRFMISLPIGYPDAESELMLAKTTSAKSRLDTVRAVVEREQFLEMQQDIHNVLIADVVYRYILDLVAATRRHPNLIRGASPRATIALVKMAKAAAWFKERDYVIPQDVQTLFPYVSLHRIIPGPAAGMERLGKEQIITETIQSVECPQIGAKKG